MKTTRIPTATTRSQFAIHFKYLMITFAMLSIGLLCALVHGRDTHPTTLGHLRSSWFHSSRDSRGATDSACLRLAGALSAHGALRTAHA
jgi:hypothetical protein